MWWSANLVSNLGVDDPLDAFAVHYGGGVVGVLATPVFMNGGIVHWTQCSDQEAAWVDAGSNGEFECSYTEFQGKGLTVAGGFIKKFGRPEETCSKQHR